MLGAWGQAVMGIDLAIPFASSLMEAVVVLLMIRSRACRSLRMFFIYILWTLASDIAGMTIAMHYPSHYFSFFLYEMPLDIVLQFSVLLELAWAILRPIRNLLPRGTLSFLTLLLMVTATAVWPLTRPFGIDHLTAQWRLLIRLDQTAAILRILWFLAITCCSQLLALGWRDRELQVATGLGFYSLARIGVTMLHDHPSLIRHYHQFDEIAALCYLMSMLYLTVSFARKDAPRQEFTPRMQSSLLSLAGIGGFVPASSMLAEDSPREDSNQ